MLSFIPRKNVIKNYPVHGWGFFVLLNVNIYSEAIGKIFSLGYLMSYTAFNGSLPYSRHSNVRILQLRVLVGLKALVFVNNKCEVRFLA